MGIIKNTLQQQINNSKLQQSNDTTATIIEYNHVRNTAKIRYHNPNGEGILYRDNVAIANTLGGVTGSGIFPGQTCSITFINNNLHMPLITGLTGSNYAVKTCTDQGAYLVDLDVLSCEKPDEIVPMIDNWLEEENTDDTKYNNDLGDYTDTDTSFILHEMLNSLDKYKPNEQGITHLGAKSTIKFKENGDIDIFVGNNIGLRVSKADKSISLYGTLKINGQKIDLSKLLNDIMDKE